MISFNMCNNPLKQVLQKLTKKNRNEMKSREIEPKHPKVVATTNLDSKAQVL